MRAGRRVSAKPSAVKRSDGGDFVRPGGGGAHGHGAGVAETDYADASVIGEFQSGEEVHVLGGVALHGLGSQRTGKFAEALGGALIAPIGREVEDRHFRCAIEKVGNEDGVAFRGEALGHFRLRGADSEDIRKMNDAGDARVLRTEEQAVGNSVSSTNLDFLFDHGLARLFGTAWLKDFARFAASSARAAKPAAIPEGFPRPHPATHGPECRSSARQSFYRR